MRLPILWSLLLAHGRASSTTHHSKAQLIRDLALMGYDERSVLRALEGDPDSFTPFRPYLAHFFPVSPRFLRVFTVSTRRFQRAPSRSPGPRDSGKGAQTPFCRPS